MQTDENMRKITVRDMLMMSTAKTPKDWFGARHPDRVKFYFENTDTVSRPGSTVYEYDSPGSFVLGAALERRVGMPFMDYLRPRLFDKIGVSDNARCLKCPGGHSWSDSAVICTARDLLLLGKFLMNGGSWNGEQLLSREYVREATSKQIDNNPLGVESYCTQGYGYLIWRTYDNSFFFNGMGCQLCVCVPDKAFIPSRSTLPDATFSAASSMYPYLNPGLEGRSPSGFDRIFSALGKVQHLPHALQSLMLGAPSIRFKGQLL